MTRYLTLDDVIAAYARAIGTPVVRDKAALLSAIGRPQASAFGVDAYPTLALKAAALMHSLAQNQSFVDGNKRIAWICAKLFVQLNGKTLVAEPYETNQFFREDIARGASVAFIELWVAAHMC